jgi:ribonuclease D
MFSVVLGTVCERELGIGLDKSSQTSDWARHPLSTEQLRYAALDAEVLLALHDCFPECSENQQQDESVRAEQMETPDAA